MSLFPPRTSPSSLHLCAVFLPGWQNGRLYSLFLIPFIYYGMDILNPKGVIEIIQNNVKNVKYLLFTKLLEQPPLQNHKIRRQMQEQIEN